MTNPLQNNKPINFNFSNFPVICLIPFAISLLSILQFIYYHVLSYCSIFLVDHKLNLKHVGRSHTKPAKIKFMKILAVCSGVYRLGKK